MKKTLSEEVHARIQQWLDGAFDPETKSAIQHRLERDPASLIQPFASSLEFGTAGIRAIMDVGPARLNIYTVRAITFGLGSYLKKAQTPPYKIIIGYDSRHHSKTFANAAAFTLAALDIQVILAVKCQPTPFLSFACRYLSCSAAIMITASHNPPNYNGYKVYWNQGEQILSPHDDAIKQAIDKIDRLDTIQVAAASSPLVISPPPSLEKAYIQKLQELQLFPKSNRENGHQLSLLYSNLHGTGITLLPPACQACGFTNIQYVMEQKYPDGDFPTTKTPNPETKEALALGMQQLIENNQDLLLATDPDADRLGAVVNHQKSAQILTGNQLATLYLYFLCENTDKHRLKNSAVITTIVTTDLLKKIANDFQLHLIESLTGFKYIAKAMDNLDGKHFLLGCEESYGYLHGTYARDKDGIGISILLAEMALHQKKRGKTLCDYLNEIYTRYGTYLDAQCSIQLSNSQDIDTLMKRLRQDPLTHLDKKRIVVTEDYLKQIRYSLSSPPCRFAPLPASNVLLFRLEDGSKWVIRPSGTEPKVKIYGSAIAKTGELKQQKKRCKEQMQTIMKELQHKLGAFAKGVTI